MTESTQMQKNYISSRNTWDSIGTSGRIEYKEYLSGDQIKKLNKTLKISLDTNDRTALNAAFSHYKSYLLANKHTRDDTYEVLKGFEDACDAFIKLLQPPQKQGAESSASQRVLIEYSEMMALEELPKEIKHDFLKYDISPPAEKEPFFITNDEETRNNLFSKAILHRHAVLRAISQLDKEGSDKTGGRPIEENKIWLEEALMKIFDKHDVGKAPNRVKSRWAYFARKVLEEALPSKNRPRIAEHSAISKRINSKNDQIL